jgi:hypothetical protein
LAGPKSIVETIRRHGLRYLTGATIAIIKRLPGESDAAIASICDKPNSKPLNTPERPNCQHLVVRLFRPRYK